MTGKPSSSFYPNSATDTPLSTYLALIEAWCKATLYPLSKPALFPVSFDHNRPGPIPSVRRESILRSLSRTDPGTTLPGTKVRHQDFRNSRRRDFDADTYYPQPRAFGIRPRFSQARFSQARFSQARFEAPSGPSVRGVVKWFSPEKGFGFVELSDGSGDAFLHGSVLSQSGINVVQPVKRSKSASGRDIKGRTSPRC